MGNPLPSTPVSDYIPVSVIASKRYLPISRRQVAQLCQNGFFSTAFKPGTGGKTSKWMVLRAEVLRHKVNQTAFPNY